MVPGAPGDRLSVTGWGGSVCVWTVGSATLKGSKSISKTRWRRGDDRVLNPAVLSFIFWLLRQTRERAHRGRNRGRGRRDENKRWRQRVESRVILSVSGVHSDNFLRSGSQQPLQIAVLLISLWQVVILGGVGRSSVSSGHWDMERDRELGWLWGRKFGRGWGWSEGTRR